MKYSSCITNSNIINEPLEKILDSFIDAGFDGIDIPGEKDLFPIKKIKPILDSYSDKIKIAELTAAVNPSRDLINPAPKKRKKGIDYIKYCIDTASDLDVNLTHMCFMTNSYNLNNTLHSKLEILAIESIKILSKYAENKGVKLMIEPLFKQDVTLIKTCDKAVILWAKALNTDSDTIMSNPKNFGLLLDIFHMHYKETNLLRSLEKYHHLNYHTHVADHPRGLDFDRRDSKFVEKAIKKLKSLDYKNFISFESFDPSVTLSTLKESLEIIKEYE